MNKWKIKIMNKEETENVREKEIREKTKREREREKLRNIETMS